MKYKNVLLATKTNQIGLYFELMDSKAQELNFKLEGGSSTSMNFDDDDDDEKTEEEGDDDQETEEEKEEEKKAKYSSPPPAKITKVEDEDPMDFGVAPATSIEDEVPISFEGVPPPPPPPKSSASSSMATSASQINKPQAKSSMKIVSAVEDEMPIGFEVDSIYRAPTEDEFPIDTDLSAVNLNFFGSKSTKSTKSTQQSTAPPKPKTLVPALIKMTVTSVVAIAGKYDGVSVKLSAQMTPDTAPPAWGDHFLLWKPESSALANAFSLKTLKTPTGSTEVEVSLALLGLPSTKGAVDIYLDSETSKEHVRITVVPGPIDQKASSFAVLQRPEDIRAGDPITVAVTPRDAYSNEGVHINGADVAIVAQGKSQVKGVYSASKSSAAQGRLEYTLTFATSGKYSLYVSYDRAMLSGSPAELAVAPGPLARIELMSIPAGYKAACSAQLPDFRIAGQDAFGNSVRCSPGDVRMELYAAADRSKAGRVEGQRVEVNAITGNLIVRSAAVSPCPGTYGEYVLRVAVGGVEATTTLEMEEPRLDVGKCAVERPMCTQLGALCKFVVRLRDALGAPYVGPVEEVALECRMERHACEGVTKRSGDRAEIVFFPTRAERCEVAVRVDGQNVPGSPFALDVVKPCELKPIIPVGNRGGDDSNDDKDGSDGNGKKGLAHTMIATTTTNSPAVITTSPKRAGSPTAYDTADCDLQTLPF